jgi:hypothetical protein
MLEIFWILDFIATFLGILFNLLLLFIIIKTSSKGMKKYSYSFLLNSIFDIMIALVEMMTSHVSFSDHKCLNSINLATQDKKWHYFCNAVRNRALFTRLDHALFWSSLFCRLLCSTNEKAAFGGFLLAPAGADFACKVFLFITQICV